MDSNVWTDWNFHEIDVLNQRWKTESSYSYARNHRPYHGLCYITAGAIEYKIDTGTYTATAGDLVFLKKYAHYQACFRTVETRDVLINFQSERFGDETVLFEQRREPILIFQQRTDLIGLFSDALRYALQPQRTCMLKSVFYQILDAINCRATTSPLIEQVKQLIDQDTQFQQSEADIAKQCAVSLSTLQRAFKHAEGKTIGAYKNEHRITAAKECLMQGESFTDIAEHLGFCDTAHFSKYFKRWTGLSPKQYLRQVRTM